jgi:hypothetical protein
LAIFLGRPPRIVKDYFHFTIPSGSGYTWSFGHDVVGGKSPSPPRLRDRQAASDQNIPSAEPISYTADTRCAALFAFLKEDVLRLLRRRQASENLEDLRFVPTLRQKVST